jgi:trk system potassium uptake protein TrkH
MMFIALIGGCAGSTSGGLKVMRILLLQKQGSREMKRLLHPKGVFTIKFDQKVLPESVIQSVCGFIIIYILLFVVLLLILLWEGLDFTTAFGAIAACLSNTGTGIGKLAHGFDNLSHLSKVVIIMGMLAGRLEIFTLLVLFTPTFWKR